MMFDVRFCPALCFVTAMLLGGDVSAQEYNALAECRAQSLELDQIHDCMDGYLDLLDENMQAITGFLGESLSGDALVGLNQSQQAFDQYRRQNCLWYLEFSSPRSEAEQIAKNCLAAMTRARLQELQDLVTADKRVSQPLKGFYVYGAERNSFQPCASSERYWVEGETGAVGLLQQSYLNVAVNERQLLHAVVIGKLDDQLQAPEGHQGVLQLEALIEVRAPTESDCTLPNRPFNLDFTANDVGAPDTAREVFDDEQAEQEDPEQQLMAYFGQWVVDCIEVSGRRSCSLAVTLTENGVEATVDADTRAPRLVLNRTPKQSTFIEVIFPDREIESPSLVRWQVDQQSLGDIVGSEIRVDQLEARLLVGESEFLVDELMPLLIAGRQVSFSVLASVDDITGEVFSGTLQGLTKALTFADDFVRENG